MKFKLIAAAAVSIAASTSALAVPPKLPSTPTPFTPITTTIGAVGTGPSLDYVGGFKDSFTLTTGTGAVSLISLSVTGATGSFADTASHSLYNSGLTLRVFQFGTSTQIGSTSYSTIGAGASQNLFTTLLPTIPGVLANTKYTIMVSGTSLAKDSKFTIQGSDIAVTGGSISPVPEPESYAMLLAGLGLVGTMVRHQRLMVQEDNFLMVHAGLLPQWTAEQAMAYAAEVEAALQGDKYLEFLFHMYGNQPNRWSDHLTGMARLRLITNAMTRLRVCTEQGEMEFAFKGELQDIPNGFMPWFDVPTRATQTAEVIFGHWSALGLQHRNNVYSLDTGCLWGGQLTAMNIHTKVITQVASNPLDKPLKVKRFK